MQPDKYIANYVVTLGGFTMRCGYSYQSVLAFRDKLAKIGKLWIINFVKTSNGGLT